MTGLKTKGFAVLGLVLLLAGVLLALPIIALFMGLVSVAHAQTPTTPTISTVAITSSPGTDNTYATGDTITVSLTFSETVTVDTTGGTPYVTLDIGGQPRNAAYTGAGTATGQVLFAYTVRTGDRDGDGVSVLANSLTLNGGTIQATDDSTDSALTHAVMTFADHKVDTEITLVSNLGQAEATDTITISATSSATVSIRMPYTNAGYDLTAIILDVKTPSQTLEVEVTAIGQLSNPDPGEQERYNFTFGGSVKETGRQRFTLDDPIHRRATVPVGSRQEGRTSASLILTLHGVGSGTVEIGATTSSAQDADGQSGFSVGDPESGSTVARIALVGHQGTVPYIYHAEIASSPADGIAYRAGERIELFFVISRLVNQSGIPQEAEIWLGNGAEHRRVALFVGYKPGAFSHLLYVYDVRPGDQDTDGVFLGQNPLGLNADSDFTISRTISRANTPVDLSWEGAQLGTVQAVDGSKTDTCGEIRCLTLISGTTHDDVLLLLPDYGAIGSYEGFELATSEPPFPYSSLGQASAVTFNYGGQDHGIWVIELHNGEEQEHLVVLREIYSFVWSISGILSQRSIERLALDVDGTVFNLEDNSFISNYGDPTDVVWQASDLSWEDGDEIPVKLFERPVTATFDSATYAQTEGDSFDVTVTLGDSFEKKEVTLPLTAVGNGGAGDVDYSGVPESLVFAPGETEKTFTVTITDDDVDDDDESITLSFGTLPTTVKTGGDHETATITIRDDDDPEVEVEFGAATYTAPEGGTATVEVTLSADPERTVVIPVTKTEQGGAAAEDYSGVPSSVTFNAGQTSRTFTFTAAQDAVDDDDESVRLGFGTLPARVSEGARDETTVNIRDDDDPEVTVSFGATAYAVAEGGTQAISVTLSADPERTIAIPVVVAANQGGATSVDYSGLPASLTFSSGETSKLFTFMATQDTEDDDGESVKLGFGTLPARVSEGARDETTVHIGDDDDPYLTVQFGADTYAVAEGGTRAVTVTLSSDPERTVAIPVVVAANQGGATSADYSGVPASVTFNAGQTSGTLTFNATDDTVDDDDESVRLEFGTLPARVSEGATGETTLNIGDDDDPHVTVQFGADTYAVAEGGTQSVTVTLSADPERTVTIPVTKTEQSGATSADYSGVPSSVTFNSGQTSRTFTFTAAQDTVDDDDESVKLAFGPLPSRVSEGSNDETTVNIGDDDDPEVTVSFGAVEYTAPEDGMVTVMVTVILSADPERTVEIQITKVDQGGATSADYSGVPSSVIFNPGETAKSFTFTATQDTVDDDGESVKLEFGMLPGKVSGGATDEATVIIRDDDDPEVTVAFVQDAYRVAEGRTVTVRITLSADPERTVVIPLSKTEQNGASSADYSGVPASVTFNSGETSKTFDFAATDDTISDTGESVKLTFGALPDRVTEGTPAETTVNIRQVSAQFQLDCSQAEWCADLKLDDYTAVDWGWSQLQYNGSFSPPANLSVKSFIFRGVEYTIRAVYVVPGIYPEIDNAYNRVQRGQGEFLMSISHGETWEAAPEGHYQDWELHIGGVVLPFGEAALWGKRWFLWYGLEFQEIFTDWTSSTVNKIGIREIPSVQHLPTVPPAPAYVSAAAQDSDGLRVSWRSPWTRQRNQGITGYIVQWKQASHSWSDSAQVSSMEVGPKSISAQVNGLAEGVLYTVRVIATNAVGDGPPSEDAIGRPQPQTPHLVSAVVNGQTLTMRYNRQLDMNSVPAESAFMVIAGQGLREVSSVSISGTDVTLTLAQAVTSIDKVQAGYVAPADASGTFLRDLDGNHAYTIGGDLPPVTNETDPALLQPLTAQFTNVPSSHNGEDSFTFNIEFSESVWVDAGLGKDNLLRVTGGTVTAAHWLDRRTEEWQVTIQPNADGDITVVLPGGRSCSVAGAPCAAGDRVLSGEKTVTISGPTSQQQAVNTPATGAPGISGTARAGETLTATTTGISDTDGLANATFAYQWLADDTEISGARSSSYTVTDGDVGKVIKVRVSFTDDAGNEESLTSHAVAASPPVVIRDEEEQDEEETIQLTATTHDVPESHDGSAAFTFELRFSKEPASGLSYTTVRDHAFTVTDGSVSNVRRLEPGKNVRWKITVTPSSDADVSITLNATTDCSAEGAICTSDGGKLSGGLELVVPGPQENSAATGAPTINGTAQVGEALTASTSGISDANGLVNASFTYQWLADDTEISGATGSRYTLVAADEGKAIKVSVSFTDDAGNEESVTSAATSAVAKPPLTATVHDAPASHDGSNAFTFELRFSENMESFSYATLQEHALTVTGGSVSKARRLEAGKNVRWEITVTPSSNADVIIALPVTTDCAADGAICTEDGRKLSNRLEVTVAGPGG